MNAAEDFLLLLLHAHAVAAGKIIQQYNPTQSVTELADAIVANYVHLHSKKLFVSITENVCCIDATQVTVKNV